MTYRALILRRLAVCERNIAEGERRIAAQQALLQRTMQQGLMGRAHAATLRLLNEAQAVHRATRDRLLAELQGLEQNPRRVKVLRERVRHP